MLKNIKESNKYAIIFIISIIIVFLLNNLVKIDLLSDDGEYLKSSKNIEYFEYITSLYQNVNGRIVVNSLLYFLFKFGLFSIWKSLNIVFMILLAYTLNRLFKEKVTIKDITITFVALGFISFRILSSSFFWITGSIAYLWSITLGLFALIPIADSFFRKKEFKFNLLYLLAGIFAILSMEQMGAIIIGFYILYIGYRIIKQKQLLKKEVIAIIVFIVFFLILFCSPSNFVRYQNEAITNNETVTTTQMILRGITWTYEKVFVEQKFIVWLFAFVTIFIAKQYKDDKKLQGLVNVFTILIGSSIAIILITLNGIGNIDFLYQFKVINFTELIQTMTTNFENFVLTIIPYIFWTITFILQLIIIFKISKNKFLDFVILFAALCTLIIMWFSPTIYRSGNRTVSTCAILLLAVINKLRIENKIENLPSIYYAIPIVNIVTLTITWWKEYTIFY